MPQRIQRKRTKGFKLPPGAIYVGRPTRWGNPYRVGAFLDELAYPYRYINGCGFFCPVKDNRYCIIDAQTAADAFEHWIKITLNGAEFLKEAKKELAGKDLACWCGIYDSQGLRIPCHADVLLRLVNA
jgi:hypothetical protein